MLNSKKYVAGISIAFLVIMLALLIGMGTANAEPGDIIRCSTDSEGAEANDYSLGCCISSDGRYVAFESEASNLVPGDTNGERDVFRKDLQTGAIVLCSTDSVGTLGNGWSYHASISSDGRYVSFTSAATNLMPGDTGGFPDIFRKDLETGALVCCSIDSSGVLGDNVSGASSISSDGRYVAFNSAASNLVPGDTFGTHDVFRKDLETGAFTCCSVGSTGAPRDGISIGPSISSDGRYVAFYSYATNLVSGDNNGTYDVFRADVETGAVVRCSTDSAGAEANGISYYCSISSDGRYVAFESYASNLVPGDSNGTYDVFRKDLETGAVVRCSTDSMGTEGGGGGNRPSINSDGRYVAFSSGASDLVLWDTNDNSDIFRKDLQTGAVVCCSTDSAGEQGRHVSGDPSINSDGGYVAFQSHVASLVPGDTNGEGDIFRKEPVEPVIPPLSVTSVVPTSASQSSFFVGVEITGAGFYPSTTARLEKSPGNILNILYSSVTKNKITGTILFFGAEPGAYDVVVINPDGEEVRLTGGFDVTPICGQGSGTALLLLGLTLGLLSLAGPSFIRRKRRGTSGM